MLEVALCHLYCLAITDHVPRHVPRQTTDSLTSHQSYIKETVGRCEGCGTDVHKDCARNETDYYCPVCYRPIWDINMNWD